MLLSKELTTVTPLSKIIALVLFITLPIVAFLFGMRYQVALFNQEKFVPIPTISILPTGEPIGCTMDAKICPDGSAVGRVPPDCEFERCPTDITTDGETKKFTGTVTSINYDCHVDGVCGIGLERIFVIINQGGEMLGRPPPQGSIPEGLLDEDKEENFVGKMVEVYAATSKNGPNTYTLQGDTTYYIKLINNSSRLSCGGIQGKTCPVGFYCKYDGIYPDATGICMVGNR